MKRLITIGLVAAVMCMAWAPASFAGITGSRHDMAHTGNPYTATLGAFADYGACSACHVPHGAQGARLFPNTEVGSTGGFFGPLCMTCHDQTAGVNDINVRVNATVMNSSHGLDITALTTASDQDQTVTTSGLPYVTGDAPTGADNIECLSCHDVHNTNDDFRPFLQVTLDDLCEDCHSNRENNASFGTANAVGAGSTHPAGPALVGDIDGIASAGAGGDSPMVGGVGTEFTGSSELVNNVDSDSLGSTWADAAWNSGMQLSSQGTGSGTGGVDCISCHNVHWDEDDAGSEVTTSYLGIVDDDSGTSGANNDFCEYCHQGSNAGSTGTFFWNPGSTAFSHPNDDVEASDATIGMVASPGFQATTSAQTGLVAAGSSALVCTSCHGIHPQKNTAATAETEANTPILLNHTQARPMDICSACHSFAALGFNHHPVGGAYATAGNTAGGVSCGGGDTEGYNTCHGASGTNGSVAHNRTAGLGSPDTGTWGASYMCVVCHTTNPSTYTLTTPYTAGGTASHFVGDAAAQTYNNARTTAAAIGSPIRQPAAWASGLTSLYFDGTGTETVLPCEGCHRLAAGNLQDGDGASMMLVEVVGADLDTVDTTTAAGDATDFTDAPYMCTGCHWVPGGTHPLLDADGTQYTIGGTAAGQTYTGTTSVNCESCHSAHDADTNSGSYILDGSGTAYGTGTAMEFEPTIDYTSFCAVCHGTFE